MRTEYTFDVPDSDLGDLRALVTSTADLPDSAEVRVRTRLSANGRGSKIKRISISEEPNG
jgi:hypothetical protein